MYKNLIEHSSSFVIVVEGQGFANAARKINVCPSVISNHVLALEQHLGKKLLHRTTRRLHLTKEGEIYFAYAKELLQQAMEAKKIFNHLESEPNGVLKIAVPLLIKKVLVDDTLNLFMDKYPKITVEACSLNDLSLVSRDLIDIAMSTASNDDPKLVSDSLIQSHWGIFAAPSYLAKRGRPKKISDLQKHNCLLDSKVSPQKEWIFAKSKKVSVSGNYIADNGSDLVAMALRGQGLFWSPVPLVQSYLAQGQLVEIKDLLPPKVFDFQLCYKPAAYGSNVRLFVDFMKEVFQVEAV